jgi:transcriptional regulator with XRE-family HTH domain
VDRWELEARRLVGKRISELRRGKNWTQEDLAEAAGLHRTYVADIERGARNPSMASLVRLAGALGARMGDLFPDEVVTLAGRAPRP